MNLKSIFGGVAIGKDTSGYLKPSARGLAIKVSDDRFVVNEGGQLVDVNGFIIDGGEKYVYRVPTNEVTAGDVLVTSDNPFNAIFVLEGPNRDGTIPALDPRDSTKVSYTPPGNLFGTQFLVKAISFLDGFGGGGFANNPLQLLLLGDGLDGPGGETGADSGLTTLLLLQALSGQAVNTNKLLPLLLLKGGKSGGFENLLLLQNLGVDFAGLGSGTKEASGSKEAAEVGPKKASRRVPKASRRVPKASRRARKS